MSENEEYNPKPPVPPQLKPEPKPEEIKPEE
jgi:hypothetical protein